MEKSRSAYGAWLAMVMNERQATTEQLAKHSGIDGTRIEELIAGSIQPEEAKEEIYKIAEALLTNTPIRQMDKVLEALAVHTDLRNWRGSCDGGCCSWNAAIA